MSFHSTISLELMHSSDRDFNNMRLFEITTKKYSMDNYLTLKLSVHNYMQESSMRVWRLYTLKWNCNFFLILSLHSKCSNSCLLLWYEGANMSLLKNVNKFSHGCTHGWTCFSLEKCGFAPEYDLVLFFCYLQSDSFFFYQVYYFFCLHTLWKLLWTRGLNHSVHSISGHGKLVRYRV